MGSLGLGEGVGSHLSASPEQAVSRGEAEYQFIQYAG